MTTRRSLVLSGTRALWVPLCLLGFLGCNDDTTKSDDSGTDTGGQNSGDGDGDGDPGDGDGTPGDGDGTPGDGDGAPDPECGNGVVEDDEECDDGNNTNNDACTNDCKAVACGDGIVQPGEECDAGPNNGNNNACKSDCTAAVCGDGFVGPGEGCDDGNDIDDDECTNECALQSCGDGMLDVGEACDDGNDDETDECLSTCVFASCGDSFVYPEKEMCDEGPLNSDTAACTSSCLDAVCGDGLVWEDNEECDLGPDNGENAACLADCSDNVCGDGFKGPMEGCDDGNMEDGDGCSSKCEIETCGDGVLQAMEECDDGNDIDTDDCTGMCLLAACGDGFLYMEVGSTEECDLGNENSNSGDCTLDCKDAFCGDGLVHAMLEQCDNGPENNNNAACTSMCMNAFCGDGLLGPGEACDDGNQSNIDACTNACQPAACGDGFVQPVNGEECEPPYQGMCDANCKLSATMQVQLLSENFNGLPNVDGASARAEFEAALPIWGFFNLNESFRVATGSLNTGAIYSLGSLNSSERALGGIASGTTGTQGWGVCIQNQSAADYWDITVSYVGEQWRGAAAAVQTLFFAYTTNATIAADINVGDTVVVASGGDPATGWFNFPVLDFASPNPQNVGSLNGNDDANRTVLSQIISGLVMQPGSWVCLRWLDVDNTGGDHALAVDDLVVTATTPN